MKSRPWAWVLLFAALLLPLFWRVREVSGQVVDLNGMPVPEAVVRVKATAHAGLTDQDGRFSLSGFSPHLRLPLTAWYDGSYIAGAAAWPWDQDIQIVLAPYPVVDDPGYGWVPPAVDGRKPSEAWSINLGLNAAALLSFNHIFLPLSEQLALGCRDCHGETIYDQWAGEAHALGTSNQRFLSMYNGTDVHGRQSPPTRFTLTRDYGRIPLPPDLRQPYYGPGYKLDFPDTAGNCAACHLPGAALANPLGIDPNDVAGTDAQGVHCDFCHKISGVRLDPESDLPYENMPGVLSFELRRPGPDRQVFFGPFDDVDVGPDTYLPLMKESAFCAPCHSAAFWGVSIYASYDEWLASPYSDPTNGQTCQDCHMAPDMVMTNFAPGRGGLERRPESLPGHGFPGGADASLLQKAISMDVSAERGDGKLTVTVTVTNAGAGHHVPTDSPLRQMILLVRARGVDGGDLLQVGGGVLPEWAGAGDPAAGYLSGLPGTAYAKVLADRWVGTSPTSAYWNPTRIVSDNRIPALGSDTTRYIFEAPASQAVEVVVQLLYRRAFINLADLKGWTDRDIQMGEAWIVVTDGE